MKTCFIVCPIGNDDTETRKRSDTLFKHVISPVCDECNFTPIRIDRENTNGSLTDEIFKHICEDDLVIADLTENNPNVFYEIGYRAALDKPAIHLMSKNASIPFDVSTIRTYFYDLSDLDNVAEMKERLIQTIQNIDFAPAESKTSNQQTSSTMFNAQLLQEIYKVQDSIAKLESSINAKDSSMISVLADKLSSSNAKSPETTLIETLLPKRLDNPEQFNKFTEFANKLPKK